MLGIRKITGLVTALLLLNCVAIAQAAPRNVGVQVATVGDSATITVNWTPPPGNYDGFVATLAMTGAPVQSAVVGNSANQAVFRVGKPLVDGQACVVATRGAKTGNQACVAVRIVWPTPIPDITIDSAVVTVVDDSTATVTVNWTLPAGDYDGIRATLAMTDVPIQTAALGMASTTTTFRVSTPLADGQACVALTRGTQSGQQACTNVHITWPEPIPDVVIDSLVIEVDTAPVPVDTAPTDTVVILPPDTTVVTPPPADYTPESSAVAALPRQWIDTRMPVALRTVPVTCSTLQSALNSAQDGDALALPAGSVCTGHYTYSGRHPADKPVILTTATALPPEGTRMTPAAAGPLAVLETNSSQPALEVRAFASGLRVVGIAFRAAPQTKLTYYLANLGPVVRSVDSMAHDITLDRVYMQGHDSLNLQRCVSANAARVAVIDSWIAGCHYKGADAQAIIAWNSPGPIKVVNNHLEGSGENFMLGGADPAITGLIASDIEFRRNHVIKPLAWQDSAGYNPWTEKNLFELKSARRVLVEGNVFENNWVDGQAGLALVLKSANQSGHCDWCGTSDVIFRWNVLKNSPGGFSITRGEAYSGGTYDPQHNIDINNVLFDSVGTTGQRDLGARRLLQLGGIQNLSIRHLTALSPADSNYMALMILTPTDSAVFSDNLLTTGRYGVSCDSRGYGATALTNCWLGGVFTGNVLVGVAPGASQGTFPAGNSYPATLPYTGTAGVDQAELARRIAGVVVAP